MRVLRPCFHFYFGSTPPLAHARLLHQSFEVSCRGAALFHASFPRVFSHKSFYLSCHRCVCHCGCFVCVLFCAARGSTDREDHEAERFHA
jgi:hypothetical protein